MMEPGLGFCVRKTCEVHGLKGTVHAWVRNQPVGGRKCKYRTMPRNRRFVTSALLTGRHWKPLRMNTLTLSRLSMDVVLF